MNSFVLASAPISSIGINFAEYHSDHSEEDIKSTTGNSLLNYQYILSPLYEVEFADDKAMAQDIIGLLGKSRIKRDKPWNQFLPPTITHEGKQYNRKSDDSSGLTGYYRCKCWRTSKSRTARCPALLCVTLTYVCPALEDLNPNATRK